MSKVTSVVVETVEVVRTVKVVQMVDMLPATTPAPVVNVAPPAKPAALPFNGIKAGDRVWYTGKSGKPYTYKVMKCHADTGKLWLWGFGGKVKFNAHYSECRLA